MTSSAIRIAATVIPTTNSNTPTASRPMLEDDNFAATKKQ